MTNTNIGISLNDIKQMVMECVYNLLNEDFRMLEDAYSEYSCQDILFEFLYDKENGIKVKQWDLIPAEQYKNLLRRYMSAPTPQAARIPQNIVYNWMRLIVKNAISIEYITQLAGHSQ